MLNTNIGIYRYYNTITGKSYVGKSTDLAHRHYEHIHLLRKNTEPCTKLNRAWQKYGEESFVYEILCYCGRDELDAKEIEYIKKFDSMNNGYNCTAGGGGILGYRHTDESKRKIGDTFRGKHISAEHVAKVSAAQKGRRLTDEHKAKLSAAWTDERRESFIKSRSGMNNPNYGKRSNDACNIVPVICNTGECFYTAKDAAAWCGLKTQANISSCCHGNRQYSGKHPITGERLSWRKATEDEIIQYLS